MSYKVVILTGHLYLLNGPNGVFVFAIDVAVYLCVYVQRSTTMTTSTYGALGK